VVLPSVFEEQLVAEQLAVHRFMDARMDHDAEARSFMAGSQMFSMGIDTSLRQLQRIKAAVNIPVIASLNGVSPGGWTAYARELQAAGAAAMELNLYDIATDPDETGSQIEDRQIAVVTSVCQTVSIPVAVKLSASYTALPAFVRRIRSAGAQGVVLFNRLYQPEVDLETLTLLRKLPQATESVLPLRLHALAILHGQTDMQLAANGGICSGEAAAKAIVCGADTVQLVSALQTQGAATIARILAELGDRLAMLGYENLLECRGVMSLQNAPDPHTWERLNYAATLLGWQARRR
jgi:dihydroorotate dehydrogenase (fumarate)